MFKGPVAFNNYAKTLKSLGPILWMARAGLLVTFVAHMFFTVQLIRENIAARKKAYKVQGFKTKRPLSTRSMAITGPIIALYLVFHLLDFTLNTHSGPAAMINGVDLGLYGLVVNSFLDPIRSLFYIVAMAAIGLHLTHAVQSLVQTLGFYSEKAKPMLNAISVGLGLLIAVGFSSIPVYIFLGGL
jgi:succinate dehydrogenase / fumarate reductase cytochrome b subunit